MLWTLVIIVMILGVADLSFGTRSGTIHLLFIAALVALVLNLVTGRRHVS